MCSFVNSCVAIAWSVGVDRYCYGKVRETVAKGMHFVIVVHVAVDTGAV